MSEMRNCIGKQTEKRAGSLKEGRRERFLFVCTYMCVCVRARALRRGTSTRYGYWIGLDCRVSSTNTRNLDVGRLLPFLFQTEISRPRAFDPHQPYSIRRYSAPFSFLVARTYRLLIELINNGASRDVSLVLRYF